MNDYTRRMAVLDFLEVWLNDTLLEDIATQLTCSEADALADLLRAYEHPEDVERLLSAHAEGDDEGDSHYELREDA